MRVNDASKTWIRNLFVIDEAISILVGNTEEVCHLFLSKLVPNSSYLVSKLLRGDETVPVPIKNSE